MADRQLLILTSDADPEPWTTAAHRLSLVPVVGGPHQDGVGSVQVDFTTRDSVLTLVEYAQVNMVAGILPLERQVATVAARASSMLGLPFHSPRAADACVGVDTVRDSLIAAELPTASRDNAGRRLTVPAVARDCRLRLLAILKPTQQGYVEAKLSESEHKEMTNTLASAFRSLGLKHGPVSMELLVSSEGVAVSDVVLCPISSEAARNVRFRIPLVQEELAYDDVIVRNLVDVDLSRVFRVRGG